VRTGLAISWARAAAVILDGMGAAALEITRAYVRAFFDLHLRGRPQALLDQPSQRFPEVSFCSP
jgi:hypothetical protein